MVLFPRSQTANRLNHLNPFVDQTTVSLYRWLKRSDWSELGSFLNQTTIAYCIQYHNICGLDVWPPVFGHQELGPLYIFRYWSQLCFRAANPLFRVTEAPWIECPECFVGQDHRGFDWLCLVVSHAEDYLVCLGRPNKNPTDQRDCHNLEIQNKKIAIPKCDR